MRRSLERILTTHAGSLSRPEKLCEAWSNPATGAQQEQQLEALLRASVDEIVRAQLKAGVDVPNDGEFGKPMRSGFDLAAWGTYIFGRLSGFGPTPPGAAAPDRNSPGAATRIVGERWEQREFADFYAHSAMVPSTASRPSCVGPITYTGEQALRRDSANLKAAAETHGVAEAFVTSIAVGSLEMF